MQGPSAEITYFLYDGECPLCRAGAHMYRLKTVFGALQTLDMRAQAAHPIVKAATAQGFDFDQGMIIVHRGQFVQGADALALLAKLGADDDIMNWINTHVYRSSFMVRLSYPLMKAARNALLKLKGVMPIHNQKAQNE